MKNLNETQAQLQNLFNQLDCEEKLNIATAVNVACDKRGLEGMNTQEFADLLVEIANDVYVGGSSFEEVSFTNYAIKVGITKDSLEDFDLRYDVEMDFGYDKAMANYEDDYDDYDLYEAHSSCDLEYRFNDINIIVTVLDFDTEAADCILENAEEFCEDEEY